MRPFGNRLITKVVTVLIFTCLLLVFLPASLASTGNIYLYDPGEQSIDDNPSFHLCSKPSRLVLQFIDHQLYKWYEYDNADDSTYQIYLLEPERKLLSEAEAARLLELSGKWEMQYQNQTVNIALTENPSLQLENVVDNRTIVGEHEAVNYPFNNIGFLTINFPSHKMRGTGFIVGPHMVMTNAHNVYTASFGGWYQTIYFTPGQYEKEYPNVIKFFSTYSPIRSETNESYLYYDNQGDRTNSVMYDYAALFFDQRFEGISTFIPLEFNYDPTAVSLVGYPGVVRDVETLSMWRSDGAVILIDDYCLYYEAYSSGGSSGSPVLTYNQQAGTYRVVAIHSFTFNSSKTVLSGGPHLNDKNRQIIEQWLLWTPERQEKPIESITLNKTSLSLQMGEQETLVATVLPEDASNKKLIWSSSNTAVAIIDNSGMVKTVGGGSALIRARTVDGSKEATCTVSVESNPETTVVGDINGDGAINVLDAVMAVKYILQHESLDTNALLRADVNADGVVNILDVNLIIQYSLGMINILTNETNGDLG